MTNIKAEDGTRYRNARIWKKTLPKLRARVFRETQKQGRRVSQAEYLHALIERDK